MKHKANYQGNVIHAVHNNTLVLWHVLGDSSQMGLEDVVTVQKGHFPVRFDPHLMVI
jgi:hypothetical protein